MNRGQIRLRATQVIGADNDPGAEEVNLINDFINEAVLNILSRTRLSMKCLDLTVPAATELLDIPDTVLWMYGLFDSDGNRWVRKAPELVDDIGEFAMIGSDLLKIVSADSSRSFSVYYVSQPTAMSADGNDPSVEQYGGIPAQFHGSAILNYVKWKLAEYTEQPSSQGGERFRVLYEGRDGTGGDIRDIKRFINKHMLPAGRRRPPLDSYSSANYI